MPVLLPDMNTAARGRKPDLDLPAWIIGIHVRALSRFANEQRKSAMPGPYKMVPAPNNKMLAALEDFGRERLSEHFFMGDFLYSEISAVHGIHDKLPYSRMVFSLQNAAFNLTWHDKESDRYIRSRYGSKPQILTKPGMDNHEGDHSEHYLVCRA